MTWGKIVTSLILTVLWFGLTGPAQAQTRPEFIPEFKLLCHPTEPVKDVPLNDPSADPFGNGPWYVNDDRSIWAASQPLFSDKSANRIMWIKPPGLKVEIIGRRLDGDASPLKVERNASYLRKGFEPNRLYFPEPGCWEVTARSGEKELVFVVEVNSPKKGR